MKIIKDLLSVFKVEELIKDFFMGCIFFLKWLYV